MIIDGLAFCCNIHIMNIRSIADRIGMDYEGVLEDYCGDVRALSARLAAFPSECQVEKLTKAASEGNGDEARAEAKRIRKLAEKIGLGDLAARCHAYESSGDPAELAEIMRICSDIIPVIGGNA